LILLLLLLASPFIRGHHSESILHHRFGTCFTLDALPDATLTLNPLSGLGTGTRNAAPRGARGSGSSEKVTPTITNTTSYPKPRPKPQPTVRGFRAFAFGSQKGGWS